MFPFPRRLRMPRPAFRATLFVKVTGLVAATALLVVAVNIVLELRATDRLATANLRQNAATQVGALAGQTANAVRFGDAARVGAVTGEQFALTGEDMAGLVLTAADGSVLAAEGDLTAETREALRQLAAGATALATTDEAGGFLVVTPILNGETRVGGLATHWLSAPARARAHADDWITLSIAFAALALMLVVAVLAVRRMIALPMAQLEGSLEDLAEGRYDQPIAALDRSDEIGDFARHVADLRDRLRIARNDEEARDEERALQVRVVAALRDGLNALARRDLTNLLAEAFDARYEPLRIDYNETVAALQRILGAVILAVGRISEGSDDMAGSADELSQRTETQAATLEQTAAALQQISASVSETASNARKAERIARGAQEQAQISEPIVREAIEAMAAIQQRSSQIAQIITLIDDISFQTNLLALNAGVEAARAGESGRGFAVVATEVRALAQRSSDAAREIKELVNGSTQQVDHGVDLVRRSGEALQQFSGQVDDIASLMTEVAQAADDQAHSVTEINVGVSQLDTVTQQNAAMVQQTTVAIHDLRLQSSELASLLQGFRLDGPIEEDRVETPSMRRVGT